MLTFADLAQTMAARPTILVAVGLAAVASIAHGTYAPMAQAIRARNDRA